MEYWLIIYTEEGHVKLLFDDNGPCRGATIAGVRQANNLVKLEEFEIDDNGKRWDKGI